MPTIDENKEGWNTAYDWADGGEEWSRAWGGAASQWFSTILPRLRSFVPSRTILEIAPGFGRWTRFLESLCVNLVLVDLNDKCIDACKRRFASREHVEYHVNDGRSLAMIADDSIDLLFSFDSLVHVESDVLFDYFAQFAHKLTQHGIAFIHHSNLGEYVDSETGALRSGASNRHWRALSVTADSVRAACEREGLICLSQELLNWGGNELNDAITVAARPNSRWGGATLIARNADFMRQACDAARIAQLYDWGPLGRETQSPGRLQHD